MSRTVTIGVAQITGRPYEPESNRELSLGAAEDLFSRGANVVVLPELIVSGYGVGRERLRSVAEPVDGPTVSAWREIAARADGVIVGGFCEAAGGSLFNAAVAVGADGVLLHYRKLHLFATEKGCFTPGDLGLPTVETEFGTIAACVCYDLRFVETARALSLQGAELICVPTAWLPGFDQERWDEHGYCPQARNVLVQSNLDQVYIACASQAGEVWEQGFLGSSIVCDPYGQVLVGPLPPDHDELAVATVDLEQVSRAHNRGLLIDPLADRRSDVYGLAVEGSVL